MENKISGAPVALLDEIIDHRDSYVCLPMLARDFDFNPPDTQCIGDGASAGTSAVTPLRASLS